MKFALHTYVEFLVFLLQISDIYVNIYMIIYVSTETLMIKLSQSEQKISHKCGFVIAHRLKSERVCACSMSPEPLTMLKQVPN